MELTLEELETIHHALRYIRENDSPTCEEDALYGRIDRHLRDTQKEDIAPTPHY